MNREKVLDLVNVIYERVSNNENNLFSDGKYTEALEILIDYYEVGLIEELKNIREEISRMRDNFDLSCMNTFTLVIKNIDNRIAELKGENK